jgi:serine phosphatase RsbU (regulator of sigma subunit)
MNGQALVDAVQSSPDDVRVIEPLWIASELRGAMERLSRASSLESLLYALAREFRIALKPDRVAVRLERLGPCRWPLVVNLKGEPADGADLPVLPGPRIRGLGDGADDRSTPTGAGGHPMSAARLGGARHYLFAIRAGSNRIGHVYVERRDPEWAPPREKIRLLSLVTCQAALLVEHLQLLETRRELEMARKMQLELFPHTLDLDPRLDIAARNHPAFAVSGDYYDCQATGPGKVAFIVADVMGHGLAAATLMTRLHAVFRAAVKGGCELKALDRQLNEVMETEGEGKHFATGILGLCDLGTGVLRLASAGHPWPSILCGGRPVPQAEEACTFPWGLPLPRRELAPARLRLTRGSSVLAYTDGLTEVRDAGGCYYSPSHLERDHARNRGLGAQGLCDSLLDCALTHADPSRPLEDDMTVLAICLKA